MRMYFVDWYFVSKIVLTYCDPDFFLRSLDLISEKAEQFLNQTAFLTCSCSFLRSMFKFKLEKIIGIQKSTGKS